MVEDGRWSKLFALFAFKVPFDPRFFGGLYND